MQLVAMGAAGRLGVLLVFVLILIFADGVGWGGAPKIAKLVYNSNNYRLWYL